MAATSAGTILEKSRDTVKDWTMKTLVPALVVLLGLALMVVKIIEDGEPGAIPLSLIVIGVGWLLIPRARKWRHHT